jgi:Tfp pilus assembly protein PilF
VRSQLNLFKIRRVRVIALRALLAVLWLGAWSSLPPQVHAQAPSDANLAAGISQLKARDFVGALVTLNEIVAREANRPGQEMTVARAHAYRAAAFIGLEQSAWAMAAALEALKADPRIVIAPGEYDARVVTLFETARNPARDPEAAGQTAEMAGRLQDAFLGYLSALQSLPEPPPPAADQRLRERIIKVVQKLEPKPEVPEEARTLLTKAETLLNAASAPGATSDVAAAQAAIELRRAVRIAPWWPDAMATLAMAAQRADQVDEARMNLNLYQLSRGNGHPVAAADSAAPAAAAAPATNVQAVIYVYFPPAARGLGAKSKLICDGQRVADLTHKHYVVMNAAPGFHTFEYMKRTISASFEGGKEHFIRLGIAGYPAHITLPLIEPAEAAAEIRDKKVLLIEAM